MVAPFDATDQSEVEDIRLNDFTILPAAIDIPEGEDIISDEREEEATVPGLRRPGEPTPEESEDHKQAGHVAFRSWCPNCIRGHARNAPRFLLTHLSPLQQMPFL